MGQNTCKVVVQNVEEKIYKEIENKTQTRMSLRFESYGLLRPFGDSQ